MKRHLLKWTAFFAYTIVFNACSDDGAEQKCDAQSPCPNDMICNADQKCVDVECTVTKNCTDADMICDDDNKCVNKTDKLECSTNHPCAQGHTCDKGVCTKDVVTETCDNNKKCTVEGEFCNDLGECVVKSEAFECGIYTACTDGLTCVNHKCTELPDITLPTTPTGFSVRANGCSHTTISWSELTNPEEVGINGYKIYRDGAFLKKVPFPITSTGDRGLTTSTTYSYTISAVDVVGNESKKSPPASVTTNSDCPTFADIFYEGAIYPSAKLAPIKSPYIITGYGNGYNSAQDVRDSLPSITMVDRWVTDFSDPSPLFEAVEILFLARSHSERPIPGNYCTQSQIADEYASIVKSGVPGMSIDEFGSIKECITYSLNTLRPIKTANPKFWILAWYYSNKEELTKGLDVIDVYVGEAYGAHEVKPRVETAISLGLEGKTIIGLGTGPSYPEGTPTSIDSQLKTIRSSSPRIASNGVGFYYLSDKTSVPQWPQFSSVLQSHFEEASPEATITAPSNEASVSGEVQIHCTGTTNSSTMNPITSYRFFVDNTLEEVSSFPSFFWDTSNASSGEHILTIHTVAEDYRAGVSQISVYVQ